MRSRKLFTETVEFQILSRLPDLLNGIANDIHFKVLGLLGVSSEEFNNKMMADTIKVKEISNHIILSSIGKETVKVYSDEEVRTLEKMLKVAIQKEIGFLKVLDFYPEETKSLTVKRTQWESKFTKAEKNIISLAKGEKFIHEKKPLIKPVIKPK